MGERKTVIHLFGAAGSGTSTLGRYIAENLGLFFMDTDDYFWQPTNPPYREKRPAAERIALMRADIGAHVGAVISGSLTDWGDVLIPDFTLAIRIVTDTQVRLERIRARESAHFGARIEKGGDMYESHIAFMDWAAAYDNGGLDIRSRAEHDKWQKLLTCPLITLDGAAPTAENFTKVTSALRAENP